MAQDFQQHLKKVQTLSSAVGRGLEKFNQPPVLGQLSWLDCLTRLNVVRSDFSELYNTVHGDPTLPEMVLSDKNVLQPTIQGFDAGRFLRVKDILEIESEEEQMLTAYLEAHRSELADESAEQLEDRINEWQQICVGLASTAASVAAEVGADKKDNASRKDLRVSDEEDLNRLLRTLHEGRLLRQT